MKILVLESSGNKKGSSDLLAEGFIKGAEENGHELTAFDVIRADIRPCLGCNSCGMSGPCVQKDDYENKLKGMIKAADMLVFVMPVYYYTGFRYADLLLRDERPDEDAAGSAESTVSVRLQVPQCLYALHGN